MARIELEQVVKAYGDNDPVIENVNLDIGTNEFCVFVGPSGCGKSTLLRMIAGLEDITAGELRIGGRRMNDIPPAQRGVAMVFQSYALFPHMTVFENMAFGLRLSKASASEIDKRVRAVAKILKLDVVRNVARDAARHAALNSRPRTLLECLPKELSGGQRQRVAIGRAMVREPSVFLFDEPLSNLDASLRVQTRFEIAKMHRDFGQASTVYVTHDQVEAMTLADRIVLLNSDAKDKKRSGGSVAQFGSPMELYHRPCNKFVAGFIGSPKMNFFPASLVEANEQMATVRLPTGEVLRARVDARQLAAGSTVAIGIRPEHAEVGMATQHVIRPVQWQERLGEATYLYVQSGKPEDPWVVKAPGNAVAQADERVPLAMPAEHIHVFDTDGRSVLRTVSDTELPVATVATTAPAAFSALDDLTDSTDLTD
jgi:multiple sugar transport system ATP-binding protein